MERRCRTTVYLDQGRKYCRGRYVKARFVHRGHYSKSEDTCWIKSTETLIMLEREKSVNIERHDQSHSATNTGIEG